VLFRGVYRRGWCLIQQQVLEQSGASTALTVTIHAPAKLNLSLAVTERRADGYHDIESLMVPVTLHDTLHVTPTAEPGISLRVRWGGKLARLAPAFSGDVPAGPSNLVVRAAEALAREAGVDRGLEIDLLKQIPAGAGLGGGSSDAAALLQAAADAWQIDWPVERLAALGATLGSDIPWFFAGGPAVVSGRGDQVRQVEGIPPLPAVIVKPAVSLSTAAVYGECRPDASRRGDADLLAVAMRRGLRGTIPLLHNALESPARAVAPEVNRLLDDLRRAGGLHPMLTGSGSACFTLARTVVEARRVAARMEALGWPAVFPVRICA
jgi:4-diphosphocytidyl-2-C-methyl-D-erythritol kinase